MRRTAGFRPGFRRSAVLREGRERRHARRDVPIGTQPDSALRAGALGPGGTDGENAADDEGRQGERRSDGPAHVISAQNSLGSINAARHDFVWSQGARDDRAPCPGQNRQLTAADVCGYLLAPSPLMKDLSLTLSPTS